MKVDYTRSTYSTQGIYSTDNGSSKAGATSSTGVPTDSLTISGDVELAARAMAAAKNSPDIRPEAVERGRALLEKGIDVNKLADTMIESMSGSWQAE